MMDFETLQKIADACWQTAEEKGWHEGELDVMEKLCLMHSEISEAVECYRLPDRDPSERWIENGKPEGLSVELADTIIRIFDLCGSLKINIAEVINEKMAYNNTRPYRHGGKRA
jgi:NTP pyrophosphatase (non-canonical NTP hydrolase)